MIYTFWRRLSEDNQAPSVVPLDDDYEEIGETEAFTVSEAVRKWHHISSKIEGSEDDEEFTESLHPPDVGDVITTEHLAYIKTPQGLWATIEIMVSQKSGVDPWSSY